MNLLETMNGMLRRDGLVGYTFSGPAAQVEQEVVGRVTACARSAVSVLGTSLVERAPGLGIEVEVAAEYDAAEHSVEVEVTVVVHHPPTGHSSFVAMELLESGFQYLAEPDVFRSEMTARLNKR